MLPTVVVVTKRSSNWLCRSCHWQ